MSVRKVRDAFVVMVAFLALLWAVQVLNWADGYRLDADFGILPHHVSRIPDIFAAPFLHFSWQHIEGNSVPLFVLGFLAAYRGIARFLLVSLIVAVVSGLAVWLFQSTNELTVGASGLIFGYFSYVLLRGIFDRNLIDIAVGVAAGAMYWTILSVALPGVPGISWIGHLGGLAGGVVAAWILRTPPSARPAMAGGFTGLEGLRGKLGSLAHPTPGSRGSSGGEGRGTPGDSRPDPGGSGTGGAGTGGSGTGGRATGGTTGSTAADELLRKIDEMGL